MDQSNTKLNRDRSMTSFSLARGLGMLAIVAGHSMADFMRVHPTESQAASVGLFSNWGSVLGGGMLAMFFLVSGCGFFARSPKRCMKVQKKLLLWPYIMTGGMVLLTKVLLAIVERRSFAEHGGELVLTYLLGFNAKGGATLFGLPIDSISILWFLLALFNGWNLYNLICRLKSRRWQQVLVCASVLLGWALTCITKIWPFALPMSLIAVGYLAAGAWIRERNYLEGKAPAVLWIICIGLAIICLAFGNVNIMDCIWALGPLDVAGSFAIGFTLMKLCFGLENLIPANPVSGLCEKAGFYSIWIVCLHAYEKIIFPWYRLALAWPLGIASFTLVCTGMRLVLIYVLYKLSSPWIHALKDFLIRRESRAGR